VGGLGGGHVSYMSRISCSSLCVGTNGGIIVNTLANKFEFGLGATADYNGPFQGFLLLAERFFKTCPARIYGCALPTQFKLLFFDLIIAGKSLTFGIG
jgi:hypothetical protein